MPGTRSQADADADAARIAALGELGSATVGESGGLVMRPRVHAVWRGARIAGPAFPVRCSPGDNLAIHVAVTRAPAGSVLAVDVGGEEEFGYWGEVLATGAEARGITGLVIDGGVRDSAALERHGFPVFATAVALRGASKSAPGTVGLPVEVGGVRVEAHDVLVGDSDGVVVVRAADIDKVLAAGQAREQEEQGLFSALRGGATTLELLELDASPVTGP
jgi:4-hydroxy-4-methyl-2-oxoglutarate aldolase